ncbi:MAG TPA: M48 family metallopeptidase [Planctomycetota bacterium]|nr:M48 family metallopeptidase [Planctomycetota bacterium]
MLYCKRALFIVLIICSAGTAGCARFTLFTTAQEIEIGEQVQQEVEANNKLLGDLKVSGYVSDVGNKVASQAHRQDVTYTFKVIDSPNEINAFALPGGSIYIYTGLLKQMKTESELAAVLAHEAAHIAHRDSMAALSREVGAGILLQVLLGGEPSAWQDLLGKVASNLTFLKFSRDDERRADRAGVDYMVKAGYDPQGMVNLLTLFTQLSEKQPSSMEVFLSTHPGPQERIGLTQNYIQESGLKGGAVNQKEYEEVKRAIPAGTPK